MIMSSCFNHKLKRKSFTQNIVQTGRCVFQCR